LSRRKKKMKYRKMMPKKASKRNFTKNALRVKKINHRLMSMRGGIRL